MLAKLKVLTPGGLGVVKHLITMLVGALIITLQIQHSLHIARK
jgi:hypothetical protein